MLFLSSPSFVPGIVKRLNFNASFPDLFVSVCTSEGAAEVRKASSGYPGRLCDLQITPNLGRDFGSLLTQFGPTVGRALCGDYDIIGHLHTKKSVHVADRPFAEAWNTFLLENLIGGERGGAMVDSILSAMEALPRLPKGLQPNVLRIMICSQTEFEMQARPDVGQNDLHRKKRFAISEIMIWRISILLFWTARA